MTVPLRLDDLLRPDEDEASSSGPLSLDELLADEEPGIVSRAARGAGRVLRTTADVLTGETARRAGRAIGEHPGDVARQTARGLAESGLATARGVEQLVAPQARPARIGRRGEILPAVEEPPIRSTPAQRLTEEVREFFGEPESTPGRVAGVASRVVGDVAQFLTPGAALQATKVAAPTTLAGRVALSLGTGAPIDAAIAASGPEQSTLGGVAELTGSETLREAARSLPTRVGAEVALGAGLGTAVEVALDLVRRARAIRPLAVATQTPEVVQTIDDIAAEARELSIVKGRTPEQQARLRALDEQLRASEAELAPPARTAEEVAQASELEPPLPRDIVERERRRAQVPVEGERRAATAPISAVLPDTRPMIEHPQVQAAFRHVAERQRAGLPAVTAAEAGVAVERTPEAVRAGLRVEPPRAPKFKKLDDAGLEERYFGILDRMQAKGQEAFEGTIPFTRQDPNASGATAFFKRTGTAVSGKAGRAIGRLKDDGRIAAELEAEFAARGISHDDVLERYLSRFEAADVATERRAIAGEAEDLAVGATQFTPETGATTSRVARLLARAGVGGAAGGAVGSQVGETPAERRRNAVLGVLAGAGLAVAAPRLIPRGRGGIIATAPEVGRAAADALGVRAPAAVTRATEAINPDEYVNVAKFALDPTGEQRLRDEVVDVVAATGMSPKQRISWTETKRVAATLGLRPSDLLQGEAQRLNGAEMLAMRNIVSTNIDAIEGLSQRLADANLPGALRERLEQGLSALEGQNAALLERFVQARSAAGRDLNNLKILANRTLDPTTWLAKTKRLTGDAGFTPEVRTEVLRLLNQGDRAGLVRYLASVRRSPWYEKLTTFWKAGLLTNPKTHAVNITSNTTMAVLETAKDNPAVVFDRLMSLWTGEITKAPTTVATLAASARGVRKGLNEAVAVLRGGSLEEALKRFDIPREVNFDNAILDTYTKTVFRLLGAEDRIFRNVALQRSLAEQAQVLASREGLNGARRAARVQELLLSPTDDMAVTALRDAEVAIFTDETELSRGIKGFFGRLQSPAARTAAEFVLPFKRTPAAVATRVFEFSPFGFVGGGVDAWRVWRAAVQGKPMTALQRRAAERLGRATTGASALLVGMWLYEKGLATGAAPTFSSREREQWRTEGRQPNSVLIGGQWRSVGRLSPLGNIIALGANLRAALVAKQDQTVAARLGELAASTVRTVADQPFVTGVRGATEAVLEPQEAAARYFTNFLASAVPAGVAATARTVDPTIRRPEGVAQTIQSRLPVVSRSLPAQRTVFGEPLSRSGGVIANILDPTSPITDVRETDPLVRELSRVEAAIGRLKQEPDESAVAFEQRQVTYGQRLRTRLERLVRAPGYRRADAEKQRELIEDAVTELRRDLTRRRRGRRGGIR